MQQELALTPAPGPRRRDFTGAAYRALMGAVARHYRTYTVAGYLAAARAGGAAEPFAILRHDVDADPGQALEMARVDHALGLRSTFYFRAAPRLRPPAVVRAVAGLGHEVGFHYETLSLCRGDVRAALELFRVQLGELRALAEVRTACMHGSPLSRHDNRALWGAAAPADFGLEGEAYLSIDYRDVHYFTDTGMRWDNGGSNLRDRVGGPGLSGVRDTWGLIARLDGRGVRRAALLTHSDNWTDPWPRWLRLRCRNACANAVKAWLRRIRGPGEWDNGQGRVRAP